MGYFKTRYFCYEGVHVHGNGATVIIRNVNSTLMQNGLWLLAISASVAVTQALAQDRELADTSVILSQQVLEAGSKTVVVAYFTNLQSYGPQFSDYLRNQLYNLLSRSGKGFEVIPPFRSLPITNAYRDENESSSGVLEELRKLLGADTIITGNYLVLRNVVSVNIKLVDISTGRIVGGSVLIIPKTKEIEHLLRSKAEVPLHPANIAGLHGTTGSGGGGGGHNLFPALPWPPPSASAEQIVSASLLGRNKEIASLGDVDLLLSSALENNGYFEKGYLAVPHGFALVTRIEQIDEDGTSKRPPARWSLNPVPEFSLGGYLARLFTANPGLYRVIVFVVTDIPFAQSHKQITAEEEVGWLHGSLNTLPSVIRRQAYTSGVSCTALIYEFERQAQHPPLLVSGRLDAHAHLVKSGLWSALGGE